MEPEALEHEAQSAIAGASTLAELDEARVQARRRELEEAELDRALAEEAVDVTFPGDAPPRGHLHPITQIRREVEDIFLGLGYEVVDGREVETTYYNFDGLNIPPNHPARSRRDTFYLDDETVLRTETTDATRSAIFHQVEGLAVDKGITLSDLLGTLTYFAQALFGEDRRARFRTSFFPFTEPSVETDVSCFLCDGEGCAVCKHSGWIELGGSGMVDPNVLENVGYDPEEVSGFAFGWGLERMALLRHGLPDLRDLWQNDLRLLRQF